jgi:polar amino acid transport system substrate-binding protein
VIKVTLMAILRQILLRALLLLSWSFTIEAKPIMVLTEHLPPYQIDNGSGVSGFATDIVKRTFENAGISYQIEVQDWSRAYQRTLRQTDTCIYSISKSTERTPLFQWVGALAYSATAMYSLKNREDIELKTIHDAKKWVTAVTKDDITHHYLLKHDFKEGENLYVLENVSSMLHVLQGRKNIDLVLNNDTILKYRAAESKVPFDSLQKKLEVPDLPLDFHLACSLTTTADVVSKLKTSLDQLKNSGEYDKIIAGWTDRLQ